MVAVQNIINSVVREHEFVVLPEFGAILSHQVAASFDSVRGKFIPASRKLSFNESLKQDDGFLANYISRNEKMTHQEAILYIKKYIQLLKLDIENNGHGVIDGLGSFQKNKEGKLLFEPSINQAIKDNWYGFTEIKARKLDLTSTAQTVDKLVETIEYVESETSTIRSINWFKWSAAASFIGALTYFSYFLVSNEGVLNKSNLNPLSIFQSYFQPVEKVAVLGETISLEEVLADATVSLEDSAFLVDDSAPETVAASTIAATNPDSIFTETTNEYFLIAGAFQNEKQALIMKEDMISKGFVTSTVIPADAFSSKFKVAVKGYPTREEANADNSALKKVIGEIGWVYHSR